MDLKSAYLQIPSEDNSKPITAFTVPGNVPATFQRLMDKVITPDLFVTQNFDDHLKYLSLVLDKIRKANLTIGLNKCEFGFSEIKYLGFKVNEKGLHINDEWKVGIESSYRTLPK